MTHTLECRIIGVGTWTQGAPDWATLRRALRGEAALDADAPAHPTGAGLPAAERRRAPEGVRLAADVCAEAVAMAGVDPKATPCVFASTQGELAITDNVCATLARAPLELSPTRFHNSVLNAPVGYWTIATGCTAGSSAVSAYRRTFAAGLLEAAVLACADATPVLYALVEVAATGPLTDVVAARLALGVALVLTPAAASATGTRLQLKLRTAAAHAPDIGLAFQTLARDNPANADALAMLSALALGQPARLALAVSPALSLEMEITP